MFFMFFLFFFYIFYVFLCRAFLLFLKQKRTLLCNVSLLSVLPYFGVKVVCESELRAC